MGYPIGYDYDTLFDAFTRLAKYVKSHDTYYLKGREKNTAYALLPEDRYYHIDFYTDKKNYKSVGVSLCGGMDTKSKYDLSVRNQELFDDLGIWLTELTKRNEGMF